MNRIKKHFSTLLLIPFGIALIVGVIFANGFLQNIENMISDNLYQRAKTIPSDIKIIAIDEETLLQLGPYSDWNRSYFAELINILNENNETSPKVIGIDVIFSGSKDTEEDKQLVEVAKKYNNLVFASSVTVGSYLYKDNNKYYNAQYISGEGKPYDELAGVVDYGFTNVIFDDDGFVRKAYTSINSKYNGESKVYDSFAYCIVSKINQVEEYNSQLEIAFTGKPGEFETVSMSDVLSRKVPATYFKDCIVLVGAYEEGMMDSYKVPIDYSKQMYGVELQANYINAFLNDYIIYDINIYLQFLIDFILVYIYALYALKSRMKNSLIGMFVSIFTYIVISMGIYHITSYQMHLLAVPVGVILAFGVSAICKYIEMQKKRIYEMRDMLFSMAEAMSEAIEGRTPYNANHTKNVAKRCVEMLEYINDKHRQNKTDLYFRNDDIEQLYLAAMLHDVGKMDVPLEVMDKPTKLGKKEDKLRDRLELICLRIDNDALRGYTTRELADYEIAKIRLFLEKLGAFNCGRPLNEEEWTIINEMANSFYVDKNGEEIPYLNEEEIEDLHIKAGTLSEKERAIMQSHVVYTDKILSHMKFGERFRDVRAMASNHHELINGKGYPNGIRDDEIDTMTRILTIMDIYDSLIADDRPYKKPKSVKVAFEILDEEADAGKIDKELLQIAKELYLNEKEN